MVTTYDNTLNDFCRLFYNSLIQLSHWKFYKV